GLPSPLDVKAAAAARGQRQGQRGEHRQENAACPDAGNSAHPDGFVSHNKESPASRRRIARGVTFHPSRKRKDVDVRWMGHGPDERFDGMPFINWPRHVSRPGARGIGAGYGTGGSVGASPGGGGTWRGW